MFMDLVLSTETRIVDVPDVANVAQETVIEYTVAATMGVDPDNIQAIQGMGNGYVFDLSMWNDGWHAIGYIALH